MVHVLARVFLASVISLDRRAVTLLGLWSGAEFVGKRAG
jgi:hypothetical protein